ncbi:GtrA family protein [Rouxiella badensis]|uniref:GtrA family protein n=1 Tax=Rouxiella badensis TaxID=1646377 RepID=UPI001B6CCA90|nr:GtrA family protein [Rouxiella badensis]MCC3704981.1 GtrA family protein [Rouxiella badensis]MCC3747873.1 GtrA family protein [Rouxiella badensis]
MKSTILEIFKFGVIGGIGFLVDAGVLYLLKDSLGLYFARVISFICAVIATWLLNRSITFAKSKVTHRRSKEFALYFLVMLVGGCINIGCYVLMVNSSILVREYPILGVAAGSLAGMITNFTFSKKLIYKKQHS